METNLPGDYDDNSHSLPVAELKRRLGSSIKCTPMQIKRQPLTPMVPNRSNGEPSSAVKSIKARFIKKQQQTSDETDGENKISPGLARLRQTPGQTMQKQRVLERKHREAKSKADNLIGGGVSLWPEMEDMRLGKSEVVALALTCLLLVIGTCVVFTLCHGRLKASLVRHTQLIADFSLAHQLNRTQQAAFDHSVIAWHREFAQLTESIHAEFDTDWDKVPAQHYGFLLAYVGSIATLLYLLADNMYARSKLTPRRIKVWFSLLTVTGLWTLLMVGLLARAQALESAIEETVHRLGGLLYHLVCSDLDLNRFHNALLYWRTKYLPPTTAGTLRILGLVAVRDVAYYFQYYSLPIITALLTPVVKLVIELKRVYSVRQSHS